MDALTMAMLAMQGMASLRHDDAVARQGVMNHQTSAHMMDMVFIQSVTEVSVPESYAMQGLSASTLPVNAAGMNLASGTPKA